MDMLSQEYTAMALIKAKHEFFGENFITSSELVKFNRIMQQEFNKKQLGVVITYNRLSIDEFKVINGVIIPIESESFYLDIDRLPSNIGDILNDKNLLLNFFIELEDKRIKTLETLQAENFKTDEKSKMLSLVLPKSNGKGFSSVKI